MPSKYDAIVIGSGHNGLTCACYMAKAGLKVLVLEQYHSIGGMTNTEEITLPGFKSDTHAICIQFANFSPAPDELQLTQYGFELICPDLCLTHAFPDGRSISVHRDLDRTCQGIAQYSQKDADTWRNLYQTFLEQKDSICPAFNSPPPSFAERATALQNLPGGLEQYRFQMQNLRSWCNEMFETKETKALLGTWAVHGGVSPDEAGGASMAWLFSMVIQHFGNNVVKGGMRNLPLALAGFLKAHNGEIRTNAQVKKIVVEKGKAVAVQLRDGEVIKSGKLIASNAHPRHLVLDLLGEKQVGTNIARKIRRYELGEPVMVVYLALDEPVNYKAGPQAGRSVYVHASPPALDYFSRVFYEARSGLLPEEPFALICNDTAADRSRVPPGKALMKLVVQPVPYVIKGDAAGKIRERNWNEAKEPFADRIIDLITRNYIPDLRNKIVKRVVHSPQDIERSLPTAIQGTNTHGAFVPYQIGAMRPIAEMGNYRSPITNVYLCGSGSHPGPGVTMAPGRNAAQIIYRDLGLEF
jgi:beta-carotene ketolase (CrtO type)